MRMLDEMFAHRWDGNVLDIWYQDNDTVFLVRLADTFSVDKDFFSKFKTTYSACSYFSDEKTRWKGYGLIKS